MNKNIRFFGWKIQKQGRGGIKPQHGDIQSKTSRHRYSETKKMTTALRFQEQNITIENQRIKNHEMEFGWNSNPYFPWSGAIDFLCEYAEIPSRSLLNDSNFWKTDKSVFKKGLNSFSVIPWLYPTSCDNLRHLDLGHSWRPCVHQIIHSFI